MYDDAKITGISMPGVEDGVIIDYVYTRTTTKSYLPGQYSVMWSFPRRRGPGQTEQDDPDRARRDENSDAAAQHRCA